MSTPASMRQGQKLLDLFAGATTEQVQNLLGNGDLLKPMLKADLSKVDRSAFESLLASAYPPIDWTPVSEYAERISVRNERRGWGLTKRQIDIFSESLIGRDHAGSRQPLGVKLWLGRDHAYNYGEMIAWLEDEVAARGEKLFAYIAPERVSCLPSNEHMGRKLSLAAVNLDLRTSWTSATQADTRETILFLPERSRRPGLEVGWLLALNPQVYLAIDYEIVPGLIASGVSIDDSISVSRGPSAICFGRTDRGPFVGGEWAIDMPIGSSLVTF